MVHRREKIHFVSLSYVNEEILQHCLYLQLSPDLPDPQECILMHLNMWLHQPDVICKTYLLQSHLAFPALLSSSI